MENLVQLKNLLKTLRLPGMVEQLESRLSEALNSDIGYVDFLLMLAQDERTQRDNNQISKFIRQANFGLEKTFEGWDYGFNEKAFPKKILNELKCCGYLDLGKNIVIAGAPGIGKTHIAKALCHEACRQKRSVLFQKTHDIFRELENALTETRYERLYKRLTKVELLVLDDFAFRNFSTKEVEILYSIIDDRQGLKSIIMTSNRPPDDWLSMFPDPVMGGAILDRLVSGAVKLMSKAQDARSFRKEGFSTSQKA